MKKKLIVVMAVCIAFAFSISAYADGSTKKPSFEGLDRTCFVSATIFSKGSSAFNDFHSDGLNQIRFGCGLFSAKNDFGVEFAGRVGGASSGEVAEEDVVVKSRLFALDVSLLWRMPQEKKAFYYFRGGYVSGRMEDAVDYGSKTDSRVYSIGGPEIAWGHRGYKEMFSFEVYSNLISRDFSGDGGLWLVALAVGVNF